jgi:hypothetical protein
LSGVKRRKNETRAKQCDKECSRSTTKRSYLHESSKRRDDHAALEKTTHARNMAANSSLPYRHRQEWMLPSSLPPAAGRNKCAIGGKNFISSDQCFLQLESMFARRLDALGRFRSIIFRLIVGEDTTVKRCTKKNKQMNVGYCVGRIINKQHCICSGDVHETPL